jgi:hypothetical protein
MSQRNRKKNNVEKEGRKRRTIKNQFDKRKKDNKTLRKKNENGREKKL